jgi:hypothetical protein
MRLRDISPSDTRETNQSIAPFGKGFLTDTFSFP